MATLLLNGKEYTLDVPPSMPLLWVVRDVIGLTGTKFACGMALCGACTVHVNGQAVRACITPVSGTEGKKVTTIEGLNDEIGRRLQQAWLRENVPQCGYCQPGQLMSAAALLRKNPRPDDADINEAMSGNICRCGTYQRIRKAIHLAVSMKQDQ